MLDRMTDPQMSPPAPPRRSGGRLGRAWTVTAAVVVALIVLAAVAVIFATRDPGTAPAPAAPSPSSARPGPATPAASSPPVVDQAVPVSAPAGVSWALFQGVALPSSRTAGPSRVDGPVHAGYAHTPVGALLASASDRGSALDLRQATAGGR